VAGSRRRRGEEECVRVRQLIKLMRPGDWAKNVFVLPAFVFALPGLLVRGAEVGALLGHTALAFIAFCLLASGFYAVNDVIDAPRDRKHPVKRKRPVASGAVTPGAAAGLGVVLIVAALLVAWVVNWLLVLTLLLYCLLQGLYNLRIKRVMLVDVVVLATGFAIRATAGAVAIEIQISIWLLLCVFFLTLYLGFIKRLCDLTSAKAMDDNEWSSPAGYDDRIELNWLLGVSAVLAIVTYLMYALSDHAMAIFGSRALGFALLTPLVMIAIHRFYRRATEGTSDSPLAALREDRIVLAAVVLFSAGVLVSLFVPRAQQLLDQLYIVGESGQVDGPTPGKPLNGD
jgi:4-hydroxybenzoate polyprenyltransferase